MGAQAARQMSTTTYIKKYRSRLFSSFCTLPVYCNSLLDHHLLPYYHTVFVEKYQLSRPSNLHIHTSNPSLFSLHSSTTKCRYHFSTEISSTTRRRRKAEAWSNPSTLHDKWSPKVYTAQSMLLDGERSPKVWTDQSTPPEDRWNRSKRSKKVKDRLDHDTRSDGRRS